MPQNEIDQAVKKLHPVSSGNRHAFKSGVEFAESKFEQMFIEIITQNQGLKLYKDKEVERFEKLAIDFGEYCIDEYEFSYLSFKELYQKFLKERTND